ncbi:MAG: alpha/beta hydrolase [Candidatus Pacebacteria bacterium]|nr:alpha/beta hydrolase [Candidatus Paceibacterota bacterium]NUQ42664.1 alpha/beta hydrolase [Calditrichaceae bacterium]
MNAKCSKTCFLLLISTLTFVLFKTSQAGTLAVVSEYIEVNNGKIFYEAVGEGPAIIMIHDGVLHRETWDAQFSSFSHNFRVIRWDRRGYGKSERPQSSFSHLEDLATLIDTLKIETAILMGCSSGGLLAIDYTLEHPEKVAALVLVGPIVSGLEFSEHFRSRGGQVQPKTGAPVTEEIEYWAWKDPWITAPENRNAKEKIEQLLKANPQNMIGSGRYAKGPGRPALGLLSQIKIPTVILAGESDIPDVHAHMGAIQAGIVGSKRVVLINSGHLAHFEVPDLFNREVLDFLESIK